MRIRKFIREGGEAIKWKIVQKRSIAKNIHIST
jgi:hypothetical protein